MCPHSTRTCRHSFKVLYLTSLSRLTTPTLFLRALVSPSFITLSLSIGQSVDSMRSYLYWEALHTYASSLSGPFLAENFAFFGAFLEGLVCEIRERGERECSRWEGGNGVNDEFTARDATKMAAVCCGGRPVHGLLAQPILRAGSFPGSEWGMFSFSFPSSLLNFINICWWKM